MVGPRAPPFHLYFETPMRTQSLFTTLLGLTLAACSADLPPGDGATAASQASLSSSTRAALLQVAQPVMNQYIVVLRDGALGAASIDSIASEQAGAVGGQVGLKFTSA